MDKRQLRVKLLSGCFRRIMQATAVFAVALGTLLSVPLHADDSPPKKVTFGVAVSKPTPYGGSGVLSGNFGGSIFYEIPVKNDVAMRMNLEVVGFTTKYQFADRDTVAFFGITLDCIYYFPEDENGRYPYVFVGTGAVGVSHAKKNSAIPISAGIGFRFNKVLAAEAKYVMTGYDFRYEEPGANTSGPSIRFINASFVFRF
ncbi:MAG: hypothetical protein FWG12_01615 [Holophagaceae bacterium]|nr:hypothetical protein [Holophagaceae bacterium]